MKVVLSRRNLLAVWLVAIIGLALSLSPVWVTVSTTLQAHKTITASGFEASPAISALCGVQLLVLLLTIWLSKWARSLVLLFGTLLTAVVLLSSWAQVKEGEFVAVNKAIEKFSGEVSTPAAPGSSVTEIAVGSAPSIALALAVILVVIQIVVLASQFSWPSKASRYERAGKRAKDTDHPIDIWDSQR
jgi:hypothetical protein